MQGDALSQRYLKSWDALGKMLEEGKSWSGHERNVAYLNLGGSRFMDVSSAAGLALDADSRAIASTDWDRDGDLDLWIANRTAPGVTFFRNDQARRGQSLGFRLEATNGSRDGIGARVSVKLKNQAQPLIRTLRAGEGYLAQSSKRIHFGIPDGAVVESVFVQWPRGKKENFANVSLGKTHRLVEGHGKAVPLPEGKTDLKPVASPAAVKSANMRLVPVVKMALPQLVCQGVDGEAIDLANLGKPSLVVLWASWCQPCLKELAALTKAAPQFAKAGLQVVCVNIDEKPPRRGPKVAASFIRARGDQRFLEIFDAVQRGLAGREQPLALPTSFLTDGNGHLLAYYRGQESIDTLIKDSTLVSKAKGDRARDQSLPFPGSWLMRPIPADYLTLPQKLLESGHSVEAFGYLERFVSGAKPPTSAGALPSSALTMEGVAEAYADIAQALASEKNASASTAWMRSLHYNPKNIQVRASLAIFEESLDHDQAAAAQYRQILELQPGHLPATNSLAWLMATSKDSQVRDPAQALQLARQVCQATNYQMPEPLDVLAAAQAAQGDFEAAKRTVNQALARAEQSRQPGLIKRLRERLLLFEQGKPFTR